MAKTPSRGIRLRELPNRRQVLQWMGVTAAFATLPVACHKTAPPPPGPTFFTDPERRALGALADALIPPDDTPGGSSLGVVPYVERFLTAFEVPVPPLFTGGPYSGRQPYADAQGAPSAGYPANEFQNFLPLDRYTEAAWRLYLYGSDGVGGGPNDGITGKIVGARDIMKQGLGKAMGASPAPLETLAPPALTAAFNALDPTFQGLLIELIIEGAWGAPEYGGNPGLAGWQLVHYEGDIQPLGYSQFDALTGTWRERPEAPIAGPNPGADPEPMDQSTTDFVKQITTALGGKVFP